MPALFLRPKFWSVGVMTGLLAIVSGTQALAEPLCPAASQKMAIPSYFYPGFFWAQLEQAAPTVGLAIINPDSGPGNERDQSYVDEIVNVKTKGIRVLGYVATNYGKRDKAKVKSDINKYYAWYGVDGIFLDEAATSCTKKSYYRDLYFYIKNKGGTAKVVINPGGATEECFVEASDIIVNFEDAYVNYLTWRPSGWETQYPADRFWHLIHDTPETDMPNAIALSKERHAGWVYVTPDQLDNPWDTLPFATYWSDELTLIAQ